MESTSSFGIAKFAWVKSFETLRSYRWLTLGVWICTLLVLPLSFGMGVGARAHGPLTLVGLQLLNIVLPTLVMAPLLMAAHRLVVLGDYRDHAIWRLPKFYWHFVAWIIGLRLITLLAAVVIGVPTVLLAYQARDSHGILALFGLFVVVLAIALLIVGLRVILIFPAVAVGDPQAGLRKAWRDGRGHFWKMLWTAFLTWLPILLVSLVVLLVASPGLLVAKDGNVGITLVFIWIVLSAVQVILVPLFAAMASRFYQLYSQQPADGGAG